MTDKGREGKRGKGMEDKRRKGKKGEERKGSLQCWLRKSFQFQLSNNL
jgi:hypothetical protein